MVHNLVDFIPCSAIYISGGGGVTLRIPRYARTG
jgi:hypothetical protein